MSRSSDIIERHADDVTAKHLQHAGRFRSRTSGHQMRRRGIVQHDELCALLPRLARPLALDLLRDAASTVGCSVAVAEPATGEPPVRLTIAAMERWAGFTRRLLDALSDNVLTAAENDVLERDLGEMESLVARVRAEKNRRRRAA